VSLTAALASAVSGLNVAQRALSVTANNAANANTDGYSRKIVSQQGLVVGNRGAGVEVTEVARLTDDFLTQEIPPPEQRLRSERGAPALPGPAPGCVRRTGR
jgi:flagellar hook-associated protein 1 FlgK